MARPTVMTPEILERLRQAFAIGATDEEACAYAKIGTSTLYDYQNANPEFSEEKDQLKKNPILKARQELVKGLEGNPELSLKYLERKLKSEFSTRNELTGKDGTALQGNTILMADFKRDEADSQ